MIEESAIEFEHEVEDQEEVVEKFKDFLENVSPDDFMGEEGEEPPEEPEGTGESPEPPDDPGEPDDEGEGQPPGDEPKSPGGG